MPVFHFDLRHIRDGSPLSVVVQDASYELQSHTAGTRAVAGEANTAFAALSAEAQGTFTHFAEVGDAHFTEEAVRPVQVVRPRKPGVHLAEVVLMIQHLPAGHLRAYYRARFPFRDKPAAELRASWRAKLKAPPRLFNAKLTALGIESLPDGDEEALDLLLSAEKLVTTLDTAAHLLSFHPDLANVQPYTATIVRNDHILPDPEIDPDQFLAMQTLSRAIANPDHQPWSPVIECKDKDGNPLKAGYELKDENGDGFSVGQQLYTSDLSEPVTQAMAAPANGARRTASDDRQLANKIWTPTPGTTALLESGTEAALRARLTGRTDYKWTVDERTVHHGIEVEQSSIRVDGSDNFKVDALNEYLRTVYAGYRLLDEAGKPIGGTELLSTIGCVNTVLGIPVDTDPTSLDFNLKGAAAVELYFGSLGTTDWNPDVSWRGALFTALWQYGVPIIFIVAGRALTNTKIYKDIANDRDLQAAAFAIGFAIVGGAVPTAAALFNTKKVLISFGDIALSFFLQKGMEAAGVWILKQVSIGALSNAFGPAGWALRLAAAAMNFIQIGVTTGQCLSSPAGITVKVSRAIDVAVTMLPDPQHGEVGHPATAVWPSIGQRYLATLQYRNGTSHPLHGPLPEATNNAPIPLVFQDVPAGGEFRIIFGVYSDSGWLAGSWESDWLAAKPSKGTTLDLGEKSITENLVPLAPDAQYVYKERISYQDGRFAWQAGGQPPATTRTALDCGDRGTLCELHNLTINNSAFQVGYAWRASGQDLHPDSKDEPRSDRQLFAVQNLSVLADPDLRLKTTSIGFTSKPAIAYAPSTNAPTQIDQTNFVLDPRGGGMHLRQVVLNDGKRDFGLGDTGLLSWGSFPLENIDALAIHPSNAVIACSYQDSKLMILPLPDKPAKDGEAPVALPVSGEGIRQGLMQGPAALAVTPDGRILVLETLNGRVQAFDTKGNPVPSFTPAPALFSLSLAEVAAELNAGRVPEVIQVGLQESGATFDFFLSLSFAAQLDSASYKPEHDPLITALSEHGVILAYDPGNLHDPALSAQITVIKPGESWVITDPRGMAWQVLNQHEQLAVFWRATGVEVRTQTPGQQWLLLDHQAGAAWQLSTSTAMPDRVQVFSCLSYFPLRTGRSMAVTFADMGVEAQGYIYILSYQGTGSDPAQYVLDIYGPDGRFVLRSPDPSVTTNPQNIVAGRIAVDIWRNLYALGFETLRGPNGAPQPGLAHWVPTPPLFTLALTLQKDFNERNIGAVTRAFIDHQVPLSAQAFIIVDDPEGAWQVKDDTVIYHVYRSGDGLQVYTVPA